ncbi:MAG: SufD family Fe-S cluster assembly protein [Rhodobacteraceae bacterium]|nr:SufD family Fe-S cluster assembly protein [Paracoccaceae bacterium]
MTLGDAQYISRDDPFAAARRQAADRLEACGLPKRGQEYWKFTDPSELNQIHSLHSLSSSITPHFGRSFELSMVGDWQDPVQQGISPRALFDGIPRSVIDIDGDDAEFELSPDIVEHGSACSIEQASLRDSSWVHEVFGELESQAHAPVPRALAAVNTRYARCGVCIRADGINAKPVEIRYSASEQQEDAVVRHVFKVERGASLTILETGTLARRTNKVLEVEVEDGASFHHVQVQGREHERVSSGHVFARLGAESTFRSFTLSVNGLMTRNECVITMTGDGSTAHVAGAAVGDSKFHHDDTVFVTHDSLDCESRQVFKKVLRNGAVGVFQGKILVKPGAQKTDGYQLSQGLLLDDLCQFLAKPELEIYADDVACSHGSTCGSVDEEALFYLRSRGIPSVQAQDMLALAFLRQALDEIEDTRLTEALQELLLDWLARHHQ